MSSFLFFQSGVERGKRREESEKQLLWSLDPRGQVATSLLRIPVIGSMARGDQRLNCSMRGCMEGAGGYSR